MIDRVNNKFYPLATLMVTLVLVAGCTPPSDPMLEMLDSEVSKTKIDDLDRTLGFLTSEVRFVQAEFKKNLANGLNRWVTYSDEKLASLEWEPDPLADELFNAHEELQLLERNDEYSYLQSDAFFMQQSVWASQVAERANNSKETKLFELYRLAADDFKPDEEAEHPIEDILAVLHPELKGEDLRAVASGLKIFDWVMRNVQLLNDTEVAAENVDEMRLNGRTESLAAAGVPGLGYKRYTHQVLLYGMGDYVERGKLVIDLLRKLDVKAVMLAVKQEDQSIPWAIGIPVGQDYYLFDPKLALPIPGKKVGTIARLSEVRSNPELLDELDLTTDESLEDDTDYWVKSDQLQNLESLVYTTPESLSKRMSALERSLTGDSRMTLTFDLSGFIAALPVMEGVENKPWDIAFKTHIFRQAVLEAVNDKTNTALQDKLRWHFQNESYVDNYVIYRTARARFIKGKFASLPGAKRRNAVESFQRMMWSDQEIARLGSDPVLQTLHGIRQSSAQSAQAFATQVASVQGQMELIRRDAGIFLVQSLFDNGSVNAAGNWLEVLREEDRVERWEGQIVYLLGRSFEGRKEYIKAIQTLADSKLAQSHGNIIRARLLKKLIIDLYGDTTFVEKEIEKETSSAEEPAKNEKPAKKEGEKREPQQQEAA
ncbi:MAG: hypothetical protein AAF623_19110 [Planctomycetota bacterium]